MLDTQFERLLGDIGNPHSFKYPVRYRVVSGARANRVVDQHFELGPDPALTELFVQEALTLEAQGASLIATSCGFLFAYQEVIQAQLSVPFISSSLLWLTPNRLQISFKDIVRGAFGAASIGVLTFDWLAFERLRSVLETQINFTDEVHLVVQPMPRDGNFVNVIRSNDAKFDTTQCAIEITKAVRDLLNNQPQELCAIVLECTNLSPYAPMIEQLSGLPVLDLNRFLDRACTR